MIFSGEKREEAKRAHPNHSIIEIAKELGVMWKKTSDAEKAKYSKKAEALKEKYNKEKAAYDAKRS